MIAGFQQNVENLYKGVLFLLKEGKCYDCKLGKF